MAECIVKCLCVFTCKYVCVGSIVCLLPKSAVPNLRATDRYRDVGHLVPGHRERINNLQCKV